MHDGQKLSQLRGEIARLTREVETLTAKMTEMQGEMELTNDLNTRLSGILHDTSNALKGQPDTRMAHSWHDLADWGAKARAVAMSYLAATAPGASALEAAKFVAALQAWRELFGRDLFETALAFSMLEEGQ